MIGGPLAVEGTCHPDNAENVPAGGVQRETACRPFEQVT